jgi:hypothetical protein
LPLAPPANWRVHRSRSLSASEIDCFSQQDLENMDNISIEDLRCIEHHSIETAGQSRRDLGSFEKFVNGHKNPAFYQTIIHTFKRISITSSSRIKSVFPNYKVS